MKNYVIIINKTSRKKKEKSIIFTEKCLQNKMFLFVTTIYVIDIRSTRKINKKNPQIIHSVGSFHSYSY